MKLLQSKKGFTLIELLIVIGILGALAILIFLSLNPFDQLARARDTQRLQTVSQLAHSMLAYQASFVTVFPPLGANWQTNILKASNEIKHVITVPQVGANHCGSSTSPQNAEGNVCYSTSPASGGTDAIIWTIAESQLYTRIAGCGQNQIPVIAWIASQGKIGVTCFSSATTVPVANPLNNTYDTIVLYSVTPNYILTATPTPVPPTDTPIPALSNIPTPSPYPTPTVAFPHVLGNKIVDITNKLLVLHGVQIPSQFNTGTWSNGNTITQLLNPATFSTINSWHMNVIRIPVAAYRYQQPNYMNLLDQTIQQANQAGLYVILANFEDNRSGMGSVGTNLLDATGLTFWQFIAQHYATNPMVLYDLINEPKNTSYTEWLHGNASGVIGMQQVVDAVRAAGGKQIIVSEAIDVGTAYFNGNTTFINDPNIVYSIHNYFKTTALRTTSGWDTAFGNMSVTYPMYIGEWAFLPNANYPSFCAGLNETSGAQLVNTFLSYLKQHGISWSAWAFNQNHLVTDMTTYSPTTLAGFNQHLTCCGAGPSSTCSFGMGSLLNQYTTANY